MVFNEKLDIPKTWELIRSIPNIRYTWSLKNPYKKFCYFYGVAKSICVYLQISIFRDDQTLCWWSYFACVYVGAYVSLSIYTMYYYFMISDFEKSLPCTCLFGPVFASLPFLWIAISEQRYISHDCVDYSGRYIYPDKHEDKKYIEICSKHVDSMVKNVIVRVSIMAICFCGVEMGPMYKLIIENTKTTITQLRIPFTEPYSGAEFIGNMLLQIVIGFHGFPGFIAMEIALEICLGCLSISPKLIDHEFRKLQKNIDEAQYNELQVLAVFKYIMSLSMEADRYISLAADLVYWRAFFTPPAFVYGIGMSIFCQYMFNTVGGYALAILSYVQLYFICVYGETFQDNGIGHVLHDTEWYVFPVKIQRVLLQLIHQKQNSPGISIGPFATINIECFGVISGKIYSFVMFLISVYQ